MIENVVLIYPAPRRYSGFLSTQRLPGLVTSHAGLTILAQILRQKGLSVRVYDEQVTPFSDALVADADLVGISVQTSWAPQAYRIAARVRALGIPVVLGGVHATLNPDEGIEHADFLVRGEGEETLPELIAAIDAGGPYDGILGLTWHGAAGVQHNGTRPLLDTAALDRVPWPRLDLIEGVSDVRRFPFNRTVYFTMLTRGCDQACTYCSITRVFGRALRHRSVGAIIEELGACFDPARQFLFLMDDSLAVNPNFLKAFLTALIEHNLVPRLGWHSQLRADVADDPEMLALMRATNCVFVTCGFESVDDKSLKLLGKGQSAKDVERAIARLREHDVLVNGFFMFGTDNDRPGSVAETVRFAARSGCTMAGFMPLTPFPGTPTFQQLDREGRIFTRDWELYDVQHVVFEPRHMSAWDLYWRTLAAYPAFYARRSSMQQLEVLRRRGAPLLLAAGLAWAPIKQLCWTREVAANVDYVSALRRARRGGHFPALADRRLWLKDLLSGRATTRLADRLWSRSSRAPAARVTAAGAARASAPRAAGSR